MKKQDKDHTKTGTGKPRSRGRPSLYKPEFAEQAKKLCLLMGATDKNLADFFGISERTINDWKVRFPQFSQSLKEGKTGADMEVANAMYQMATGFTKRVSKPVSGPDGVEVVEFDQFFPPVPVAAIFWLKNRQPDKWRDRQEVAVSTGLTGPEREELDNLYRKAERKSKEHREKVAGRETRLKLILGGRADGEES